MIIKCKAVLVVPLAVLWHSWPALRVTVGRVVLAVWPQFRGARWTPLPPPE
jgi:hypothetical protein